MNRTRHWGCLAALALVGFGLNLGGCSSSAPVVPDSGPMEDAGCTTCVVCDAGDTCTPTNEPCHVGHVQCDTGTAVCHDDMQPLSNCTPCGTSAFCRSGVCKPFATAAHDAFPTIADQGGITLTSLQLVSVMFEDFRFSKQITAFANWLVTSRWLDAAGRDYGIGAGTVLQTVTLDAGSSLLASGDIAAFLNDQFDAGTIVAPSGNPNAVYVVYLPADAGAAGICPDSFPHHFWGTYQTTPYPYALIPDCPGDSTGLSEPGNMEVAAAHEIAEAATDPFAPSGDAGGYGYWFSDTSSQWYDPNQGEVADFCEGPNYQDPDAGFYAALIWSNTAAQTGTRSPCVPDNGAPYFNVSPTSTAVPAVAPGGSFTFTITGWSTTCALPWDVAVMAIYGAFDSTPLLDGGLLPGGGIDPVALMDNGVTTTVTLFVPNGGVTSGDLAIVWIGSTVPGATAWSSYWPLSIRVQ